MNPAGKSHICVLHEYAQHAMRIQPHYIFQELGLFDSAMKISVRVIEVCNMIRYKVGITTENCGDLSLSECASCHQQGHMGSKSLLQQIFQFLTGSVG